MPRSTLSVAIITFNEADNLERTLASVRFADEIVDAFRAFDQHELLNRFEQETHRAIADRISFHPILQSFQQTVYQYGIEKELYQRFLQSMTMDLEKVSHDQASLETYIAGSAEVVGLMCLRVFCEKNERMYETLKPAARKLGAAFQKINFLRDLNYDFNVLGRSYFPDTNLSRFDEPAKKK